MAVQTCSLSFVYPIKTYMDEPKVPKFDWDRLDGENVGHTEDEWGTQKRKPKKIHFIESYTIRKH